MSSRDADSVELGVHMGWRAVLAARTGVVCFYETRSGHYVMQMRYTDPALAHCTDLRAAVVRARRERGYEA